MRKTLKKNKSKKLKKVKLPRRYKKKLLSRKRGGKQTKKRTKKRKCKRKCGKEMQGGYSIMDLYIDNPNNLKEIEKRLKLGADPNEIIPNSMGQTILMPAATFGNIKLVKLLLDYGADPFQKDYVGNNAINYVRYKHDLIDDDATDIILKMFAKKINNSYPNRPEQNFTQADRNAQKELQRILEEEMEDEPDSPDKMDRINESARDIQKRFRGNRQRRQLSKRAPRYGQMSKPITEKEKMRRWMDLSKQYDEEDEIRGYEQFSIYPERLLPPKKDDIYRKTWIRYGIRENDTSVEIRFQDGDTLENVVPALKSLPNLTELDLGDNQIQDVAPLSGLTALTTLYLQENQIQDVAPLSGLTALTELWIGNNQIVNVAPLAGLTALTTLYLFDNKIQDVVPLAGLTEMTILYLDHNQIQDVTSLARLTKLTNLYLQTNQIQDIRPIADLTALTSLDLSRNQIQEITPLVELTNLRYLNLDGNQIDETDAEIIVLRERGVDVYI